MFSFTLVLKLGILLLLIRYLLRSGDVLKTTLLYAGIQLILTVLFNLNLLSPLLLIVIAAALLYNMATGYVYFWILDRIQHRNVMFIITIIVGIALSVAAKLFLIQIIT